VLEIVVPYSEAALSDYLASRPDSFCSLPTSRALARRACERARWLAPGENVLGLGLTASLRSDRPKHGDHRCHVAVNSAEVVRTWSVTLQKDARSREDEEALVERMVLNALAEGLGVGSPLSLPLMEGEIVTAGSEAAAGPLAMFLGGGSNKVLLEPDGRWRADGAAPTLLMPGSFNPLHVGHCELLVSAACHAGVEGAFELTIANADKPPLAGEEVRRRANQFLGRAPLWVTRAATFIEKARLFPGCIFVVGADTAERIIQARFYGGSDLAMAAALNELRDQGCRFLVAGRADATGRFISVEEVPIPAEFRDLFVGLPFRRDISATQLRTGQ
jgi:hypothetical protein